MDPNANLEEQLEIAARILDYSDDPDVPEENIDPDDALRLAELVQALHDWISGGGFLPAKWQNPERVRSLAGRVYRKVPKP